MFERTKLSHVLGMLHQETKLQIETGREYDPKESWREEAHRSSYTQGLLHIEVFTQGNFVHTEGLTQRSL